MTRVAVVIPCYDDATVTETVESVRAQDEEVELVVVDDGSSDPQTLDALESLAAAGVRIVRQANAGLAAARTAGAAATTAPYVFPLDADDLLEPGAVRRLADALDATPRAGVAWGDVRIFGDYDFVLRPAWRFDPWVLTFANIVPGTSLVRREALDQVGGWYVKRAYEDWDLWLGLAERGWDGIYVPGPMIAYRRHGLRMLSDAIAIHHDLSAQVHARHADLFARRRELRRKSNAPVALKLALTTIGAVPFFSPFTRLRLAQLAIRPREILALRRLRRRS